MSRWGHTMGKRRHSQNRGQVLAGINNQPHRRACRNSASALEENVAAIKSWARAILLAPSKAEQISDWIASTAASAPVVFYCYPKPRPESTQCARSLNARQFAVTDIKVHSLAHEGG